jgi:hypothetical protein
VNHGKPALSWTGKGLIRFCAPKLALRMMARVSVERSYAG